MQQRSIEVNPNHILAIQRL